MGFRRTKQQAHESHEWQRFLQENRELLSEAGVPVSVSENQDAFVYLLMHGYAPSAKFDVDSLDEYQKDLLASVVVQYLQAGFGDPGLGLFESARHEEIRHRVNELL